MMMRLTVLTVSFSFLIWGVCISFWGCASSSLEQKEAQARGGNVEAQFVLGQAYGNGRGVDHNVKQAEEWYRLAAENGHPQAQFILGQAYGQGQGVDHNVKLAEAWYRRAAENGHPQAQLMLGQAYAYGDGVSVDYAKAYQWLYLASKHLSQEEIEGQGKSQREMKTEEKIGLMSLRKRMTLEQRKEGEALARKWELEHTAL